MMGEHTIGDMLTLRWSVSCTTSESQHLGWRGKKAVYKTVWLLRITQEWAEEQLKGINKWWTTRPGRSRAEG